MKTSSRFSSSALATLLCALAVGMGVAPARAQYSADNQTNTVTAFTGWTGNYYVGSNTSFDVLLISGNGRLTNANGYVGYQALSSNNLVVVAGNNAAWSNSADLVIGYGGSDNRLFITNGGRVLNSVGYVAQQASSYGNMVVVAGNGSLWTNRTSLNVGYAGSDNQLLITNGGSVRVNGTLWVGRASTASNNLVLVSGPGSYLKVNTITLGQVAGGWNNQVVVSNGGVLEGRYGLLGDLTGASNSQGFVVGANSMWTNTIAFSSYREGVLSLINGGTIVAPVYNFDSSSSLVISNGGNLLGGVLTNQGTTRVINSRVTFNSPVVLGGAYFSDPSTNTFVSNLTVTASGALSGSNGDLFVFHQDFINQSTNQGQFNLAHAAVLFTNAATHLLSVSNSGSADLGQGYTSFDQVATNFAIGQLSIASGNRVTLAGNQDSLTNALYIGWLDIQGVDTNSFDSVTNGLFSALDLPNINLYYDKYDPRNGWLNANLVGPAAGGYDLWNGGLLLPIPEASTANLILASALLSAWIFRWRSKRE